MWNFSCASLRAESAFEARNVLLCALLSIAAAGCRSPAEESVPPPDDPPGESGEPEAPDETTPSMLDGVHTTVSDRVRSTATWLDSFLGDDRHMEEENRSSLALRLDTLVEDREGVDFNARVKARVVLPQSKERMHLVVSGYEDEEHLDNDRPELDGDAAEDRTVGLQYFLKSTVNNNVRAEGGLRFNGVTPNPYAGVRFRHNAPIGSWILRAFERMRVYKEEGWESRTVLDFERLFNPRDFFRASTTGTWYEEDVGFYYGQHFALFHLLGDRNLVTYEWNNYFRTRPSNVLEETQLRVRFSRRIHRDWILLELAPQISWRERIDYEPAVGIFIRLEFLFGSRDERHDVAFPGASMISDDEDERW
jgi:hypothetical protein